jgi:hypothetical protein
MASVGELFVNLGIKGSEKTLGALSGIKKGFGELTSMSIEAKAAIIGALYGFERLMSASSQMGTSLYNTGLLTGVSVQNLQKYQYAARQAGASNEEMSASFKSLQSAMTQIDINKGLPEGLKYIATAIGGIDVKKIHDLPYMMQQFQKFANTAVPDGIKRWALGSVGLSEGIIAGMERNMFRPEVLNKAPTYTNNQVNQLDKARMAWSNIATSVEMMFGKFNAEFGVRAAEKIQKLVDSIYHLVDALAGLAEKYEVFDHVSSAIDVLAGKATEIGTVSAEDIRKSGGWMAPMVAPSMKEESGFSKGARDFLQGIIGAPDYNSMGMGGQPVINQTITHYGDAKDTKSVGDTHRSAASAAHKSVSQGTTKAVRTSPAQVQTR